MISASWSPGEAHSKTAKRSRKKVDEEDGEKDEKDVENPIKPSRGR